MSLYYKIAGRGPTSGIWVAEDLHQRVGDRRGPGEDAGHVVLPLSVHARATAHTASRHHRWSDRGGRHRQHRCGVFQQRYFFLMLLS
jgi:hypothetical protein